MRPEETGLHAPSVLLACRAVPSAPAVVFGCMARVFWPLGLGFPKSRLPAPADPKPTPSQPALERLRKKTGRSDVSPEARSEFSVSLGIRIRIWFDKLGIFRIFSRPFRI